MRTRVTWNSCIHDMVGDTLSRKPDPIHAGVGSVWLVGLEIPYHIQTVWSPHASALYAHLAEAGCLHMSAIVGGNVWLLDDVM